MSDVVKIWALSLIFFSQVPLFSQTPLLKFSFDETGSSITNAGSLTNVAITRAYTGTADFHGAGGTGVSGGTTDRALNFTSSAAMGNAVTNYPATTNSTPAMWVNTTNGVGGLQSFTITGWFKTDGAAIGNAARILDATSGNNGILFYGSGTGTLGLNVNAQGVGSTAAYTDIGTWVFFAATYYSNVVTFYKGDTLSTVVYVSSGTNANIGGAVVATATNTGIGIGNNLGYLRPLDGYLDDIRFYGSYTDGTGSLTLSQLQAIQAEAIPELSVLTVLTVGLVLAVVIVIPYELFVKRKDFARNV